MTNLTKRKKAERRFQFYGIFAVGLSLLFVLVLILNIFFAGIGGFFKTSFIIPFHFDQNLLKIDENSSQEQIRKASFRKVTSENFKKIFSNYSKDEIKQIKKLFYRKIDKEAQKQLLDNPNYLNQTIEIAFTASTGIDQIHKGNFNRDIPENQRKINNFQLQIYDQFVSEGKVKKVFNTDYFLTGDSRDPESAGVASSVMGSVFTILICFLLSFPIAIFASIYLEEFAKQGRTTDLIEININNLAAVPSIIFGLLGLGILLNFFGLPRSTALVGGMVLSFMTLPTIIVACRSSLRAVPPSIREGALALGATKNQVVFHHVLPLAMPGTLTGTIIGLARAVGETAPLLMIGMVAFIMNVPSTPLDPAVGMPAQIYLWSESAERGFIEKTSSAIILLLIFLIVVNFVSVYFRKSMKKMVNIITTKNVNVHYGDKKAIDNISLNFLKNNVTALIGPSGCGKSTFLRCLNRMNDVIEICKIDGQICMNNIDIYSDEIEVEQLREKIGMVFQKPNPFPKSIYDNVAYGPRIHGFTDNKEELDEIVNTSLKKAGLFNEVKDRLDDLGTSLSGGQQQRLCIARAIAIKPEVILMDEPCSALDPIATSIIEELITELKKSYTIIIVTHSMQQAARVSDKTAFFHLGNLIEEGDTSKIFTKPDNQKTNDYITGRFG